MYIPNKRLRLSIICYIYDLFSELYYKIILQNKQTTIINFAEIILICHLLEQPITD
jgi:hypothetical protein